jgi:hypothetical protein
MIGFWNDGMVDWRMEPSVPSNYKKIVSKYISKLGSFGASIGSDLRSSHQEWEGSKQ